MNTERKAYLIGGGIGSLAAAAFMVRDAALPGANISIFEVGLTLGGSLDGAQVPTGGYSLRGGRMLTTDNYECTWDLYKSIPSPMSECNGTEVLQEICGHLRFDLETVELANCIPCRMPYITSMFMPRTHADRPLPVPRESKNLAFISQFVEIPDDVVFTVEPGRRRNGSAMVER